MITLPPPVAIIDVASVALSVVIVAAFASVDVSVTVSSSFIVNVLTVSLPVIVTVIEFELVLPAAQSLLPYLFQRLHQNGDR